MSHEKLSCVNRCEVYCVRLFSLNFAVYICIRTKRSPLSLWRGSILAWSAWGCGVPLERAFILGVQHSKVWLPVPFLINVIFPLLSQKVSVSYYLASISIS